MKKNRFNIHNGSLLINLINTILKKKTKKPPNKKNCALLGKTAMPVENF